MNINNRLVTNIMKCKCGETVDDLYPCSGCKRIMCFHCQTGEQCCECERYFCNSGNDECSDYVEHMSGSHLVCWDCIMAGLLALRREKGCAMKSKQ
jgi:hypothetical protein